MNHGTNFDGVGLHSVKNQMRLKAESPIARCHFVNRLSDERKIGEKSERADQARMVGFGLIGAKFAFGEIVDVDQVSLYSAMATGSYSLPGSSQNVVRRIRGEGVAIGMLEHLLIAAHLLVPGEVGPGSKFGFGRCGRRHHAGRFVGRLRHRVIVTRTGCKQKGPGETGAFDISDSKTDQRE